MRELFSRRKTTAHTARNKLMLHFRHTVQHGVLSPIPSTQTHTAKEKVTLIIDTTRAHM